ncbi:hypothetical protein GGI43DRAFT_13100 [Trichoderma evansii]
MTVYAARSAVHGFLHDCHPQGVSGRFRDTRQTVSVMLLFSWVAASAHTMIQQNPSLFKSMASTPESWHADLFLATSCQEPMHMLRRTSIFSSWGRSIVVGGSGRSVKTLVCVGSTRATSGKENFQGKISPVIWDSAIRARTPCIRREFIVIYSIRSLLRRTL